jgi:predicted nucleic acid-binding protein
VSDFVPDASLALQWFLEDETDRKYSLNVLSILAEKHALVPVLWFYQVGNGLLMASRRKRISLDQVNGFLTRLKSLPDRHRTTESVRNSRFAGGCASPRTDELRPRVSGRGLEFQFTASCR